MNQAQLQSELTKSIAENLGYKGPIGGFQKFIMSNQPASQRYAGILKAIDISKNIAKKKAQRQTGTPMPQMAEGGVPMGRFDQKQETEGVGAFVPPPMQSFQEGGIVRDPSLPKEVRPVPRRGFDGRIPPTTDRRAKLVSELVQPVVIPPGTSDKLLGDLQTEALQAQAPSLATTPTITPPAQKFDKVERPKVDTNQFLADGKTPNPNYGQAIVDAQGNVVTEKVQPNIGDISSQMITQPGLPAGAQIQTVSPTATADTLVASGTGQVAGDFAVPTTVAGTATAIPQVATAANLMQPQQASQQVEQALAQTQTAQGTVSPEAQIQAQQQTASSIGQLDAAQGVANQMVSPVQRQIQAGELVSGVANAETASKYTEQIQAATATPSEKATVAGQLASLTADFDATNPPAWAAGAIRGVQAMLQQRGLGASSIAGQALIQAAMESALPIAQADARTVATFETQNLSNRQQRAMLAAQQRAQFIGQEFDQAFQARVQNASRIGDIANTNFNAEQQIALENSRAANTMNLNNLSNRQALVIAEASALANLDLSNLSNRQQSAVQNAQNFLQMDMANLSNQQQTNMFNAQQRIQSLFTDQAATNAASQFNATSQNQVDQFFASLGQQTSQFNATQINAQEQYNAGQRNTVERFNAELNNQRDQFNAQNQMVIAQSNANWRRQIATQATAATNRANELNAQAVLGLSNQAYNNLWQYYGDTMEWAWTSAENERSRVVELAKAQLAADSNADIQKMKNDYNSSAAFGGLIGKFITGGLLGGGGFGGLF